MMMITYKAKYACDGNGNAELSLPLVALLRLWFAAGTPLFFSPVLYDKFENLQLYFPC